MPTTLHRPALLLDPDDVRLSQEYAATRWTHHRLLDFEFEHQKVIDEAAEAVAPGILRVGRIVYRLMRRAKRASRSTEGTWCPPTKPELLERLRVRLSELRAIRNADPRWKVALGWADEPIGSAKKPRRRKAKSPDKLKRKKSETDEVWAARLALLTSDETDEHFAKKLETPPRKTRREVFRDVLYGQRTIYWGTWNALLKRVDQARADVLKRRKEGLPADLRRPKYRNATTIAAEGGGFRIVERNVPGKRGGAIWWVVEMRVGNDKIVLRTPKPQRQWAPKDVLTGREILYAISRSPDNDQALRGIFPAQSYRVVSMDAETGNVAVRATKANWVRVRAKCGNWHDIAEGTKITGAQLTRRLDGQRWRYGLSLTVAADKSGAEHRATSGLVSFDWGHREHGHPRESEGIRVWSWRGDDGRTGEIIIPAKCRELLDKVDAMKSRVDKAFDARKEFQKLPDTNRYTYRKRLLRSGVIASEEELLWLKWEMRYERRMQACRDRIANIRRNMYIEKIRELRQHYAEFAFEDERIHDPTRKRKSIRVLQTEDQMTRRKRQNRDLATRYEFVALCEWFGAEKKPVTARNTTRECPTCGHLDKNGPELLMVCSKCGTVRDKDEGATKVILKRAQEAKDDAAE